MNAGRSRNFRKENKPRLSVPRAIGDAGIDVPVTPGDENEIGMHKRKRSQQGRPGNNVYGNIGTLKCIRCRKLKARCEFNHQEDPCKKCLRAGQHCGRKVLAKDGRESGANDPEGAVQNGQPAPSLDDSRWSWQENYVHKVIQHAPASKTRNEIITKLLKDINECTIREPEASVIDEDEQMASTELDYDDVDDDVQSDLPPPYVAKMDGLSLAEGGNKTPVVCVTNAGEDVTASTLPAQRHQPFAIGLTQSSQTLEHPTGRHVIPTDKVAAPSPMVSQPSNSTSLWRNVPPQRDTGRGPFSVGHHPPDPSYSGSTLQPPLNMPMPRLSHVRFEQNGFSQAADNSSFPYGVRYPSPLLQNPMVPQLGDGFGDLNPEFPPEWIEW